MPGLEETVSALQSTVQHLFDLLAAEQEKRSQMDQEAAPVGAVLAFATDSVPPGWLACNGLAVSRETYSALFAVIRTMHGEGDGSTTFNLPDYSGRFLRGATKEVTQDPGPRRAPSPGGAGDGVGSVEEWTTGAPRLVSFTTTDDGAHRHGYEHQQGLVPLYNGYHLNSAGAHHPIASTGLHGFETDERGNHHHTVQGGDSETRPNNAAVGFIIKY